MNRSSIAGIGYWHVGVINPDRRTLLFVHGAGGNGLIWSKQLEGFAPSCNALAIDLPGHGAEGGPGRDTVEGYVEAVKALLDGLGIKRVILAGLSMGGAITQLFTLTYPEMVEAAILISTGAKLRVMKQIFETIQKDFSAYVEMMGAFAISRSTPAEVIAPIQEELRKRDPQVVYHDFEACDKFDVMERLSQIKCPVLIIHGLDDLLTPTKYHEFLHQTIPGSELVKIEKAGHMVQVEKPAEVNRAIENFLGRIWQDKG